jgi:predicted Zn-dependent protease
MTSLRASGAMLNDPEINAYLDALGHRLVASDPDLAGQHFSFFAGRFQRTQRLRPAGGYIGVHTGLIAATQSESELASVLAHEISHQPAPHRPADCRPVGHPDAVDGRDGRRHPRRRHR